MMKKLAVSIFIFANLLAACKKNNGHEAEKEFKGAETVFQHGKAWTTVTLSSNNIPVKSSIVIDKTAMETLIMPGGPGGHQHINSVSLPFHAMASVLPFTHALLDWNPNGHEPAPIYDKPHFDFHFYIQAEEERLNIPVFEVDSTKFKNYPEQAYFPPAYIPTPGGVPQMGAHWVDATAPELNGQPFTETFIYGSYDGKVTFLEPMITKAFIDTTSHFSRSIPQPEKVEKSGYYPTRFSLTHNDDGLVVSLENFIYRAAD